MSGDLTPEDLLARWDMQDRALGDAGTVGMVSMDFEVEDGRDVCVVGTNQPNPWLGHRSNCLGVIRQRPFEIEPWELDE
ncbi:hypothetical protein, partial [Parafrankia soli]|uniref:hypothetical protein n=1 Tax=Parafrankia soli TaxID=2599596 RepID=UPI0010423EF5